MLLKQSRQPITLPAQRNHRRHIGMPVIHVLHKFSHKNKVNGGAREKCGRTTCPKEPRFCGLHSLLKARTCKHRSESQFVLFDISEGRGGQRRANSSATSSATSEFGHGRDFLPGKMLRRWFGKRSSMIACVKERGAADLDGLVAAASGWAHVDDETDASGSTCVMWACMFGHIDAVRVLLERGASVSKTDKHKQTVLHYATKTLDNEAVLRLLVERGGDLNARDNSGRTVLHLAARMGHIRQVRYLASAAASGLVDLNAKDNDGRTADMLAHDVNIKVLLVMDKKVSPSGRECLKILVINVFLAAHNVHNPRNTSIGDGNLTPAAVVPISCCTRGITCQPCANV